MHSALAVDARLAREPGEWHLYRARLKRGGVGQYRTGGVRRCFLVLEKEMWDWCVSRLGASCICFMEKGFMILCQVALCLCERCDVLHSFVI